MLALWWTKLLDFISPRHCTVCGRRLAATESSLCTVCLLHLPRTGFQTSPDDNPMVQLFWHLTPVEKAAAYFYYEAKSEVTQLIYDMKYHDRPDIGEDLGRLMAVEMQMAGFFDDIDLLVPVPLSPKRMRQRGYNQSEQLARGISQITRLSVCSGVLKRHHFHASQTQLRRLERQANVSHQFYCVNAQKLAHRHVLLIDDVCTTGATLRACANALSGIEGIRISVLTLAFTKH